MEPESQPEVRAPSGRRRRWSLSIRSLMVLVLVFGAGLGGYVLKVREQGEIVAAIRGAGGQVGYDWQVATSPNFPDLAKSAGDRPGAFGGRVVWPTWLVNALGID